MTPYYQDDLVTIYHGDCREWTGSGELIVTDPPYAAEFADCWTALGDLAMRSLPPGGWCFAYSGQYNLPDVLIRMAAAGLAYRWTIALTHAGWGGVRPVAEMDVYTGWKPILAYRRPPLPMERVSLWDVLRGAGLAKGNRHPWEQHDGEAASLIAKFGSAGTVIDPFMGSGSTLVAAKNLGVPATGIEIEERYCEIAAQRCSQEVLGLVS